MHANKTPLDPLLDTSKYSAKLVDGGVIAYPVNWTWAKRGQGERDIQFRVKAQVLKLKPGEDAGEDAEEAGAEKAEKVEQAEKAGDDKGNTATPDKTAEAEQPANTEGVGKAEKAGKDEL